ncbi:MAG: GC-type dockerin domain-anchored protein [Phycisphaerales bacterium]
MLRKVGRIRALFGAALGSLALTSSPLVSTATAQPCCPCDVTLDNELTSQDYFAYLTLFFASDPAADIDLSGEIDSNDYFEFVTCFFSGCSASLDEGFRSLSARTADCSYLQLFALGDSAFDTLLSIAADPSPALYHGSAYANPLSSIRELESPPAGLIALYAFDAILLGQPAPHVAPRLVSTSPGEDPAAIFARAVPLYAAWWEAHRGLPLSTLRSLPGPLDDTDLAWLGLIEPTLSLLPEGSEVGGSATPALKIDGTPLWLQGARPYIYRFFPSARGGPAPYNCLAWAFGDNTMWWQPNAGAGAPGSLARALTNNGYMVADVPCAGMCPQGRTGPKIMFVYTPKTDAPVADSNWIHAMRQQADGKWTSKNGESTRWIDIVNINAFLDQSGYKAKRGEMREIRCFCK